MDGDPVARVRAKARSGRRDRGQRSAAGRVGSRGRAPAGRRRPVELRLSAARGSRVDTGNRSMAPRAAISRGRTYRSPVPRFHCSLASSGPGGTGRDARAAYHRSAGRAGRPVPGNTEALGDAALRATIGSDGSPPRGPAIAGQAPSTLHRSARARAHAVGDSIARPADRLPPRRASTWPPHGDESLPRHVRCRAGRRDPVGRQRPGRAVPLLGREGLRGVRLTGGGSGGQPQAHRRRPPCRTPRRSRCPSSRTRTGTRSTSR